MMINKIDEVLAEGDENKIKGLDEKLEGRKMPNSNQKGMLRNMNYGYNMYAGTVPEVEVQRRRAKNKRARKARRVRRNH
jgi:hypothetical protein